MRPSQGDQCSSLGPVIPSDKRLQEEDVGGGGGDTDLSGPEPRKSSQASPVMLDTQRKNFSSTPLLNLQSEVLKNSLALL